jgi:dolichol-phosphate mannosyltransferase
MSTPVQINDLAIVLPAFNEEKDLPNLLARIRQTLTGQKFRYQVILVDDGSIDRTAEIAEAAAQEMPLRLIKHEVNGGLGKALQTGLHAGMNVADAVLVMDSDNTHDPLYAIEMVKRLEQEEAQIVIASRYQPGSQVMGLSAFRKGLSLGCFLLMKTVVPFKNVRDYSTGFRCYHSSVLKRLAHVYGETKLVEETGFVCMLEVLLKLRSIGIQACEIPYILRYDLKEGVSKLRIWRTLKRYLAVVNRYRDKMPEATLTAARIVVAEASQA